MNVLIIYTSDHSDLTPLKDGSVSEALSSAPTYPPYFHHEHSEKEE